MSLRNGRNVTTFVAASGQDPARPVDVDSPSVGGCCTRIVNPLTAREYRDAACALFASDGIQVALIIDSPGFVSQREVASIVDIGSDIAQQAIATPEEIDRAVTLGLGYSCCRPALGDRLEARIILRILDELREFYLDPRYRPSPWLERRDLRGCRFTRRTIETN